MINTTPPFCEAVRSYHDVKEWFDKGVPDKRPCDPALDYYVYIAHGRTRYLKTLKQNFIARCRSTTSSAFRRKGYKKTSKTKALIGCEFYVLISHIEAQFYGGMTWSNHSKWHLDHIIPISSGETEEEIIELCHYSNLQPLWASDNIRKGAKIPLVCRILTV